MSEDIFQLGVKALIKNKKGEILLLRTNPAKLSANFLNHWDLPGGRLHKGESLLEALKREVAEETGIIDLIIIAQVVSVISNFRIPLKTTPKISESTGLLLVIYECTLAENVTVKISAEHLEYMWLEVTKARELLAIKYPAEFIRLIK